METKEIAVDMLNEEQVQALNLVQNTNFSFFLTGRAGTGKTTFLHYIQENVDKQFVVVAPTGVAAILAGGVTIHSFFGMPFDPITPMTEFQINHDKQVMLRHVDTIIIDEVSMVRCDLIDGIDRILRKAMHNSHPFGGKQIIFSGDLYQLEPVIDRHDEETPIILGEPFLATARARIDYDRNTILFRKGNQTQGFPTTPREEKNDAPQ